MLPIPRATGSTSIERARLLTQVSFAALVGICAIAVAVSYLGSEPSRGLGNAISLIMLLSVTTSVVTLAVRTATVRTGRLAWGLVTFGVAAWGLSSLAFALWERPGEGETVSWIDVGFLAFYPALSLALWLMVRSRVVHFFKASWLDGIIEITGGLALCVAVAVTWILPAAEPGSYLSGNMKYPFLDAALLAQVGAGIILTGGRPGRPWMLLAAGISLFAVADTAYVVLLAAESAQPFVLAPLWVAGLQVMATAALQVRRTPEVPIRSAGFATLVLPLGFALAMTGLLTAAAFTDLPAAAALLAATSLVLVIIRTALTFRENLALSESQHLAMTDDLTGLANRRHLVAALGKVTGRVDHGSGATGLMICDLDGFKFINDTLGHHAGDQILSELGRRLQRADGFQLIARLGGDEFAALVPAPADEDALREAAVRWQEAFAEPVMIDGIALQVSGSVGGALSAPDMSPGELLRHADVAMYTAKADERGFEIYRPERDDHSPAQLRLAAELRAGLSADQIRIHYQPKVRVDSGRLCGVEALVRWQHPRHGMVPPDQMLAIAQRAGLMREVTSTVLDQALAQLRRWNSAGADLTMAVNLSISDLHDVDLPAEVAQLLHRHGVRGDQLVLEVTEDLVMARPERVADVVSGLRDLGVAIALDDFGAGRSSLAYVRRLQVAELKIDKQFMMRVEADADARAIVRGAVELAHELGLKVVAEGVETEFGLQLLRETGCEEAQGFLISKPVPAEEIDLGLRVHPGPQPAPAPTPASGRAAA